MQHINFKTERFVRGLPVVWVALVCGCQEPRGLAESAPAATVVKFDFDHRPLPEIPLPNDIATRADTSSATGLRLNASMIAPTAMERRVRTLIDQLDGWGVFQPITIPFSGPLDIRTIVEAHWGEDGRWSDRYDTSNDVVYLINIDPDSKEYGRIHELDVGHGNYPYVLERTDRYGKNDPHGNSIALPFDESNEDLDGDGEIDFPEVDQNRDGRVDGKEDRNGNGYLDPPEDRDADGFLDAPNYLPEDIVMDYYGHGLPQSDDELSARADSLMTFFEKETNTLIVSPMEPLQGRTTYAVVVTKRLVDADGKPVGSPFPYINHTAQTEVLEALIPKLPPGLELDDIAFTWAFTTQSIEEPWIAVREGLYGGGAQAHLGDEFPAVLDELLPIRDTAHPKFQGRSPFIIQHEDLEPILAFVATNLLGGDIDSQQTKALLDAHKYVDFHVMGSFTSPQLWDRCQTDASGQPIGRDGRVVEDRKDCMWKALDLQSWPQDLDRVRAAARGEPVYFWLVVPRKEVSARGQGKPVPVLLLGHGYTGNRVGETIGFAGFMAQFGIATMAIDNVSHGLDLPEADVEPFAQLLQLQGLSPMLDALSLHRAQDLDGNGTVDSGADFWTSYLFHTRDMMRQSALDYMQLIRIFRTFDGTTRSAFDIDGDGTHELAGDFDADGIVDVGGKMPFYAAGGSLGGIMSTILGGVEPAVEAIIPIAGGGRLTDVGVRSLQGGVPQAVILRVMGPIYNVELPDSGPARVVTQVTELNHVAQHRYVVGVADDAPGRPADDPPDRVEDHLPLALVDGLLPGDTVVVENLENGELGCAYLLPDGDPADGIRARARVHVGSDGGDRTEIRFYRGPALERGSDSCRVVSDVEPIAVVDEHSFDIRYMGQTIAAGSELRSVTEGLGLRRSNPEIRRFLSIGQMVIDPADPGVHARHMARDPLVYPSGESTKTFAMIVTTVGDMNVPASTGLTVGRAAGFIPFKQADPRYQGTPYEGLSANDIVIATYNAEAVHTMKRFTDPMGNGIHLDLENFSRGLDLWGATIPRLDPPLRMMNTTTSDGKALGGYSGAIFTYAVPEGQHGFALPGEQTDQAIQSCEEAGRTDCQNLIGQVFDVGWYMFHSIGRFLKNDAQLQPFQDGCHAKTACNDLPPTPMPRDPSTLP